MRTSVMAALGPTVTPEAPVEEPEEETGYSKKRPFPSAILNNDDLNGEGAARETHHIELSLEGSGLEYEVGDALGVIQTGTPPTLLRAVDAALKGALVDLVELRVADGLGGKAVASLWGETPDVEAALALADRTISRGQMAGYSATIIRNADPEVAQALSSTTGFFKEWRG